MRYAAVGLVLVACGRFGFEPISSASGAFDGDGAAIADGGHVAPTFVQATDGAFGGAAASLAYTAPVSAGDLLVVAIGTDQAAVTSITDSNANPFDTLPELSTPATSPMYVAWTIAQTSGSDTVTAAIAGSDFAVLRIHEYANVAAFDASATSTGSSAGIDAISVELTTATDHELVFAYAISETNTASAGTGFTARSIASGDVSEDAIENAAGMHAITATNAASPWAIEALAFEGD